MVGTVFTSNVCLPAAGGHSSAAAIVQVGCRPAGQTGCEREREREREGGGVRKEYWNGLLQLQNPEPLTVAVSGWECDEGSTASKAFRMAASMDIVAIDFGAFSGEIGYFN